MVGGGQKQYIVHFNITTNSVSVRDKAIRVTAIKKKKINHPCRKLYVGTPSRNFKSGRGCSGRGLDKSQQI